MSILLLALSAVLTLVSSRDVAGPLPFEIPVLQRLNGTISPSAGHRLHIVTIAVDEEGLFADVREFTLVTSRGASKAIGAGWNGDSIIPFDRIPLGREVGQVLPSDTLLALNRTSSSHVTIELGARGTIAFLFEVPLDARVRALRLPDGRELAVNMELRWQRD
jgi:hypothetical protein